ncbi:MAG TPA: M6 family metalloprotease domain-containing protein, partial [Candidatus Eisenbacteria bacterium]|nr:M6 family metalloprotease domain-containing protein [Candidatus Eisenbacteria bacterium]
MMPTVTGRLPDPVSQAAQSGLCALPAPSLTTSGAPRTDWLVPIIRIAFADSALVHTAAQLQTELFDTTGSVPTGSAYDYYQWVSGRRIHLRGEVVATVTLPHGRNYYANDAWGLNPISAPNNDLGLLYDAVAACDSFVDWNRYDLDGDGYVDMVWLVHAGPGGETGVSRQNLWSITSRASSGWSNGNPYLTNDPVPGSAHQFMRVDRFSVLPELSGFVPQQLCEIGVFCHEFGHALGLPDLYDTSGSGSNYNFGPGDWSLMSTGAYGGDGRSPQYPVHMGAWCSLYLGWATTDQPTQDTLYTLPAIETGGKVLNFWFQGEPNPEHFLLETRLKTGFDRNLPAEGVVLYQVDDAVIGQRIGSNRVNTGPTPGLRIVEGDGDYDLYYGVNRGDGNDPLPGLSGRADLDDETSPSLRSISGAVTNLALDDITRVGDAMRIAVHVRAPGWLPAVDAAGAAIQSQPAFGPAVRALTTPEGTAYWVSSELVGGATQILLRQRDWTGAWGPPLALTNSPGGAADPTIALLPGGDLAVAWSDSRTTPAQIWYRARVQGTWLPERQISAATESAVSPALAADARGRVFAAWLETEGGLPEIRFLSFLYASPFGQPALVSQPYDLPAAPGVTAAGNGRAYLFWPDLGPGRYVIYGTRFSPDSGMCARYTLAPNTAYAEPTVGGVADTAGTLYLAWQVSAPGVSEIHFSRRLSGGPSPRDTTLDSQTLQVQDPRLALDLQGGIHLLDEHDIGSGTELRYRRWRPTRGWDYRSTTVSDPADFGAGQGSLLAISMGNVDVLYVGSDADGSHLRDRARRLDGLGAVAGVPAPPPRPGRVPLAAPSPLRAGGALE